MLSLFSVGCVLRLGASPPYGVVVSSVCFLRIPSERHYRRANLNSMVRQLQPSRLSCHIDFVRIVSPNACPVRTSANRDSVFQQTGLLALFVPVVTWLILPVVICLSQRLSHACLSISTCTVKLRMAH